MAGSEPFATLEDKLREGTPVKKQKPRFFTSLRSVQNDKMDFSYIFLEADNNRAEDGSRFNAFSFTGPTLKGKEGGQIVHLTPPPNKY